MPGFIYSGITKLLTENAGKKKTLFMLNSTFCITIHNVFFQFLFNLALV